MKLNYKQVMMQATKWTTLDDNNHYNQSHLLKTVFNLNSTVPSFTLMKAVMSVMPNGSNT